MTSHLLYAGLILGATAWAAAHAPARTPTPVGGALEERPGPPGSALLPATPDTLRWRHLSSVTGDLPVPNGGTQQTASLVADVDGDGVTDLVGGGRWFKRRPDGTFQENLIDAAYPFTRAAVGQLIEGGRPEVVLVAGDGTAPLVLYTWQDGTWVPHVLLEEVRDGHSLDVVDVDGDGHLDLFTAEMHLAPGAEGRARLLLGDGAGHFETHPIATGFGMHEARIADLDGDGDYDVLAKPYTWEAPRIDVWLQE